MASMSILHLFDKVESPASELLEIFVVPSHFLEVLHRRFDIVLGAIDFGDFYRSCARTCNCEVETARAQLSDLALQGHNIIARLAREMYLDEGSVELWVLVR